MEKKYYVFLWWFTQKTFRIWQRIGFHILPNHFYSPIPNTNDLNEDIWSNENKLVNLQMNENKQIELLSLFMSKFKEEYDEFPLNKTSIPHKYYVNNSSFESVDAEILYCMVRQYKPKKIYEIGSGFSTFLLTQAILRNQDDNPDYKCELIVIDPYPNEIVKTGFPGVHKLIISKVQDVSLLNFSDLQENDILFIDSSHCLKIGGDVQYEFCEILPRLPKGVIIHIHDIFFPCEYPKEWILKDCHFWTEQYLLQAFLTFNESFEVLWGGHYMHFKFPDKLEETFKLYKRNKRRPTSFWLKKVK